MLIVVSDEPSQVVSNRLSLPISCKGDVVLSELWGSVTDAESSGVATVLCMGKLSSVWATLNGAAMELLGSDLLWNQVFISSKDLSGRVSHSLIRSAFRCEGGLSDGRAFSGLFSSDWRT